MKSSNLAIPVFVIGMPRSGTSVLCEAISLHEDLAWLSNYLDLLPFLPWLSILNRAATMPTLGPYLRGKKMQANGFKPLLRHLLPYSTEAFPVWGRLCGTRFRTDYLAGKSATEDEKRRVLDYMRVVLKCSGSCKRLFTKFTGPPRIEYLRSIFPDAFFIHIIRDPRAVVSSLLKAPFWHKAGGCESPRWRNGWSKDVMQPWQLSWGSPASLAAIQWRAIVEQTWAEKTKLMPGHFLEVSYEEFVQDPHGTLDLIFGQTRLAYSHAAHHYLSSTGKLSNMNYKFKQTLQREEICLVEKITRETAEQAGYLF